MKSLIDFDILKMGLKDKRRTQNVCIKLNVILLLTISFNMQEGTFRRECLWTVE